MRPSTAIAAIAIFIVLLIWRPWMPGGEHSAPPSPQPRTETPPASALPASPVAQGAVPAGPLVDTKRSPLADTLNAPDHTIADDLKILQQIFGHYRSVFRFNPTGSNREITNALSGSNRRLFAPLPRDHPAINENGDLVDRWKTPFFFHNLSGEFIEVRSAGPDRTLWTGDDQFLSNAPPKPPQ